MRRFTALAALVSFALTPSLALGFKDQNLRRSINIEDRRFLPPRAVIDDVACGKPKNGTVQCAIFQQGYDIPIYHLEVETK